MKRIARWVIRLYPAAWRARYGDEMEALLADSGADAKTVADLLTGGIRMRFSRGSFLKFALAMSVAGMLVGLGGSYLLTPEYMSHATLEMRAVQIDGSANQMTEMIQREQQQVESRTKLAAIIKDPRLDLYSNERRSTPLEDVIDQMRANIRVSYMALPGRHASAFNIAFSYADKLKAQQTVNALMNAFEEQNQEMQRDARGAQGYVLEVLDAASLPIKPVKPNHYQYAGVGCLLGFLLACVVAVIRGVRQSPSTSMLATNE
jgi:capsular polysaccharide biosynthesis protein